MDKRDYLFLAMAIGIIGLGYMTQQFWNYGLVLPDRPLIIGTVLAILALGLIAMGFSLPN